MERAAHLVDAADCLCQHWRDGQDLDLGRPQVLLGVCHWDCVRDNQLLQAALSDAICQQQQQEHRAQQQSTEHRAQQQSTAAEQSGAERANGVKARSKHSNREQLV